MRNWTRAEVVTLCGGPCANSFIQPGEPMLVISLTGVSRKTFRCRQCAGEPVPELPAFVERTGPKPIGMTPVRQLAGLPLDWKSRQSGEREPGCDDE